MTAHSPLQGKMVGSQSLPAELIGIDPFDDSSHHESLAERKTFSGEVAYASARKAVAVTWRRSVTPLSLDLAGRYRQRSTSLHGLTQLGLDAEDAWEKTDSPV